MAKTGPLFKTLSLRLGTELFVSQTSSVESRVYSGFLVCFVMDLGFESTIEIAVYNPHEG